MPGKTFILIVDDNPMNYESIARRLAHDGYATLAAQSGAEALAMLEETPVDLILLDVMMPEMDGYEVLGRLKQEERWQHIPVVMVSALDEQASVVRCIEAGADDYLTKPINSVLLRARVNSSLNKKRLYDSDREHRETLESYNEMLQERIDEQVREITSAQMAAIFATSKLAESKDPETGAHLERLRLFCRIIASHLGRHPDFERDITADFIECIYAASPLHDIGKVGIPDSILLKPGTLTSNEWEIMRSHTLIGAETLRAVAEKHPGNSFLRMGIEIAESHHERWDGTGYPYGLKGDAIPLAARILALADVYDALTSVRCYKDAFDHETSREMIVKSVDKHFDPRVVEAFLACETEFRQIKQKFADDESSGGGYQRYFRDVQTETN